MKRQFGLTQYTTLIIRSLLVVAVPLALSATMPTVALANSVSGCSTDPKDSNYHVDCNNACNLTDYFQFLYSTPTRPYLCNSIPTDFWTYQTQVGEVSSGGKSAGGSASAGSAAASSTSGNTNVMTMTPSASMSAGAAILRYTGSATSSEGQDVIDSEMGGEEDISLPPLEKSIWIKPLGTIGAKNAFRGIASVRIEAAGLMAGTDIFSNEFFRFGVLGAVNDVHVDINENNNSIDVLAAKGGVSATLEYGKWYLDGTGTYGIERTRTKRTIDITGNGDLREMKSKYTNRRISAAFETGLRFSAGRVVIQPLAGVDINWLMQDDVIESGNRNVAIITAKNTIRTGATRLGVNLSTAFFAGNVSIVPTIGGYWGHRFGELSNANRISTNLGSSYEYVGAKPVLDTANIYASVLFNFSPNMALSTSYFGTFNRIERNHTGNIGLQVRF